MAISRSTPLPGGVPAPHLVPLAPGWNLWRWICLRGTGFPVSTVAGFGAPELAAAADGWATAEAAAEAAKGRALDACIAGRRGAGMGQRTAWNRAARRLAKGQTAKIAAELGALAPLVGDLRRADETAAAAKAEYERLFAAGTQRESRFIAAAVADPWFQTAVTWQNRKALKSNLLPLTAGNPGERNARRRAQERLALSYLQRYATRNESIGFFGPVGWGKFIDASPPIAFAPGPRLVAARVVEFEPWVIHELADRLSRAAELRPFFAPRLNPFLRLADGKLYDAEGRAHALRREVFRLLERCDGTRSARDIAAGLAGDPAGFAGEKQVLAALAELAKRRAVIWRLELPVGFFPERRLAKFFSRMGDAALQGRLLAPLEKLVAARDNLAAAGTPEALDAAFTRLENRYAGMTGKAAGDSGRAGKIGRAMAYEDCRRDVSLEIGPEVVRRLAPPLSLVLASARWFTDSVCARAHDGIARIYAKLRAEAGRDEVDFTPLWRRAIESGVFNDSNFGPVLAELQARWAKLLPLESSERRVQFHASALAGPVAAAFPAQDLPFPRLIYHAPDIMVASESAEAIAGGDYQFVLGEVHAGVSTLLQGVILRIHPRFEELVKAWEQDVKRPKVIITWPNPSRHAFYSFSRRDYELACNAAPPARAPDRVLRIADLVAYPVAGSIGVRTRDGAHRFNVLDLFYYQLAAWAPPRFKMFRAAAHGPRITVDDFVLKRESWRFAAADPPFAAEKGGAARFRAARAWARENGLPRRVFMRFPHEGKPVFADLESPGFVEFASHLWRAALEKRKDGSVTVTEMLPGFEDTWLTDAQGNRYTSELRMIAVEAPPSAAP